MAERGDTVEEDLRQALQARERCPVCHLGAEAERRFFVWFHLENYHSAPTLERLAQGGFCDRHLERLLQDDRPHLSTTAEFLIRDDRARLAALRAALAHMLRKRRRAGGGPLSRYHLRRIRAQLQHAFARSGPCPACESRARTESFAAWTLARRLRDPVWREWYAHSPGLCRSHFIALLDEADPDTAAWLVDDLDRRLERFEAQFREYFRKLDYRYAHEEKGEEQCAWKRVARYLWAARRP